MNQYRGLNAWARDMLSEMMQVEEQGERTFFGCGPSETFHRTVFIPVYRSRFLKAIDGQTSLDMGMLRAFDCVDESKEGYEEFIQCVSWRGGACYFMALTKGGNVVTESLWTKEDLKAAEPSRV